MSKEYQAKQAALVAEHIKKQDIVITTALIPGRPAPKLVSEEMVASMKPGSVLVDLAVERGGNVEGAQAGEVADVNGVKIIGFTNSPGRLAASASALYAKNLLTFLEILIDKKRRSSRSTGTTRSSRPRRSPATAPSCIRISCRRRQHRARASCAQKESRHDRNRDRCRRSVRLPALDLRAGGVRRLLRGLVGDAGAAHAADVGDQRDLLGDRGRRAARGRRRARRPTTRAASGRARSASSRWCSPRSTSSAASWSPSACWRCTRRKRSEGARHERQYRRAALSRRRRPLHPGAARAVEPGIEPPRQHARHDRHGDRDRHHARRASAGRRPAPGSW